MTQDTHHRWIDVLRSDTLPETSGRRRQDAEALLLRTLELLHVHPLTEEQREEMAQALSAQGTAAATLRRFPLGNDDAPCFIPAFARIHRNA